NGVAGNVGAQNKGGMINPGQAKPIKCYNCNGPGHIAREFPRPKRLQDSDYFKDKLLLMQAQESGAVLDEEQSLFLAGEQVTNVEVIPFFKTLKEHFVGVQTALFKEVKEMEEIFDQINNEVDKNTVDKQCTKIEKNNLLIENENLIVNCLSTQLLYDVDKSRCLDLEAGMSKVHDESKHISKFEGKCL
ncbi:retrovirus-related pol polyprotein from transposon TNT 1-94, partial [Tanacetum coccineum]